jgi:hypothetical protein
MFNKKNQKKRRNWYNDVLLWAVFCFLLRRKPVVKAIAKADALAIAKADADALAIAKADADALAIAKADADALAIAKADADALAIAKADADAMAIAKALIEEEENQPPALVVVVDNPPNPTRQANKKRDREQLDNNEVHEHVYGFKVVRPGEAGKKRKA